MTGKNMEQKTYFAEPILFNRSTTLLGRGIAMYTYKHSIEAIPAR